MAIKILVTGSSGLIGSQCVENFCERGDTVYGIDCDMRKEFFGEEASTRRSGELLTSKYKKNFTLFDMDIRNRGAMESLINGLKPDVIVHTAAQPSHDWAASDPHTDFEINALGTLNLLEGARGVHRTGHNIVFVHLSSNKVYGDNPNKLKLVEQKTRYDYQESLLFGKGAINETMSIDHCTHSLFGVSKVYGDLAVQEYSRYFGIPAVILRGGCLTGPNHSGVQAHGFLNHLINCCKNGKKYTVFGYKGKQVRDNIHAYDVVKFIEMFIKKPRLAAVYNIGGGRENSISVLEAITLAEQVTGRKLDWDYVDTPRKGDHICYISDLSNMMRDYSEWRITKSLEDIFKEIANV